MHDGMFFPLFPLAIIAMAMLAGVAKYAIRMKHGYPLDDRFGRRADRMRARYGIPSGDPDAERKIQLLSSENERLTGQISRLEERIAVLERIATDPAERISREIDSLR
jgi:hypothetical protein